ncbi:MAG: tRNA dihydrouridine synthase DusB [Planctomycetes bacterium]|nr:tRNA dihydrouridine synthase DusB [Planctomycetota bacterium]
MMRFPYRVLQAPMAGCTDLPFRRMARKFGCEIAFCEMVKDRPVLRGNEQTMRMIATAEWDRPLGIQLIGRDADLLAGAARRLEQAGADVVDLNLGCPVRKVVEAGCGAALLREPDQVGRILDRLVPAVGVPVTVKMRTGFDEGDDERFLRIAKIADSRGVAAITVHGRTRRQGFSGMSNFEAIRAVKEAVRCPVIGNGDVRRGSDALRMMRETGCDGVMLARGALGNPWIYREVAAALGTGDAPAPPTLRERAAALREHFGFLRDFYGDGEACVQARRVIHWFVSGVRGSRGLRLRANGLSTPEEFESIAREFEEAPE